MSKKVLKGFQIGFLSFCAAGLLSGTSLVKWMEFKASDFKFHLRGFSSADPRIFLIGIDDPSIEALGRWPWPRSYHAALLDLLAQKPPLAIGFDVLLTQEDESHPQGDQELVQISQLFDGLTFAGFLEEEGDGAPLSPLADETLKRNELSGFRNAEIKLSEMPAVELPIEEMARNTHVGFVNAPKDSDGSVRRVPLVFCFQGKFYPSFALRLVMDDLGLSGADAQWVKGVGVRLHLKEKFLDIPTDSQGRYLINFRSGLHDFSNGSFARVLQEKKAQGEIVVVGLTGTGITDTDPTPLAVVTPLVLVHLNVIQNILQKDFLKEGSQTLCWLVLLILSLLTGWASYSINRWGAALGSIVILIGHGFLNWFFFSKINFQWPLIAPSLGIVFSYLTATTARFLFEEKEKRFVKKAFQHFVSPTVMKKVLEDPQGLELGGKRGDFTVLFSDLRMFSSYCERKTPEEVVSILNEYFDVMTEIILEQGGTLDKYLGDGMMAIFGAPVPLAQDHALCAVRAAVEMQNKLKELHQIWKEQGREPLLMGIGVNTGPMVVGNMGSSRVMNYTAVGDEVNLASRLEGLTRQFDVGIVISQSTYERVKEHVKGNLLGEVKVKGKEKPVIVYEVVS